MKVGELQAARCQCINVGCVDLGAIATELRKTRVIEQHHDNVRRIGTGVRRLIEPRL
jgi:hypothetical protein